MWNSAPIYSDKDYALIGPLSVKYCNRQRTPYIYVIKISGFNGKPNLEYPLWCFILSRIACLRSSSFGLTTVN